MRDHGSQSESDVGTGELESKVESIIRELRNVLKETIPEGGKQRIFLSFIFLEKKNICLLEMEMFLNSVMSLILLVPEDKINRPILNFSEAIVNANLPEKYGPMKLRV